MITILFLGTSSMQPTKKRNHASVMLSFEKENIMFDCGEGTQRQMRIAGVKPSKVTRLCISHWHGDHIFGIPGLLSSMGADEYAGELEIYGPKGTKKFMKQAVSWFCTKEIIPFKVHEVSSGVVIDEEKFRVEAYPVDHTIPCVGYRFIEKDKRKIDATKAKKLGLKGPILGQIQKGKSVVVDGKKIKPDQVSSVVKGRVVSYVTDTGLCKGVNSLAKNASMLILEGTLLDDLKSKAKKVKHLTAKQAATVAKKNKVEKLVITHISPRYKTSKDTLKEAKSIHKNTVVAEDFMKIKI